MDKPTKPTNLMPRSFGGVKNNWSASMQSTGYEDGVPAIYGGDNLNYQLDATGKELDYCEKICDYINAIPIGKTITTDANNKLVYVDTSDSGKANVDLDNITQTGEQVITDLITETTADRNLSNLSADGNNRLHALKSYKDEGELLTDSEGLADVKSYAHSTFDLSKFTVVGSPTITDDGIVSGLDKDNYLEKVINWDTTKSWEVRGKFVTPTSGSAEAMLVSTNAGTGMLLQLNTRVFNVPILRLLLGSVSNSWNITGGSAGAALNWNTTYYYIFKYTGTNYIIQISTDGENYTDYITVNDSTAIYSSFGSIRIGSWSAYGGLSDMKVDLKQFPITVDGVEVFSGNQTGVDTYTIGGLTVTIPYTLSKTGSKIVDSAYRTQVASVYDYQGYAPYYTLSDTDFTLPQGELYGMIERNLNVDYPTQTEKNTITNWVMPDYSRAIAKTNNTEYQAESDGWLIVERAASNENVTAYIKVGYASNDYAVSYYVTSNVVDSCFCTIPISKGMYYTSSGVDNYISGMTYYFAPCIGG